MIELKNVWKVMLAFAALAYGANGSYGVYVFMSLVTIVLFLTSFLSNFNTFKRKE